MEKLYKFQGFYFSIQLNITKIKFKYIKKNYQTNFFFKFLLFLLQFDIYLNIWHNFKQYDAEYKDIGIFVG